MGTSFSVLGISRIVSSDKYGYYFPTYNKRIVFTPEEDHEEIMLEGYYFIEKLIEMGSK